MGFQLSKKTTENKQDCYVQLGCISKTFGLKGGVFLHVLNCNSQSIRAGAEIKLVYPNNPKAQFYKIEKVLPKNRVFFTGLVSIEQAQLICGAKIYMKRQDFPALDSDEIYLADILNFQVLDVKETLLGTADAFSDNGAQTLVEIKTKDKKLISLPFVRPILKNIDEKNKIIHVDPPFGLFE